MRKQMQDEKIAIESQDDSLEDIILNSEQVENDSTDFYKSFVKKIESASEEGFAYFKGREFDDLKLQVVSKIDDAKKYFMADKRAMAVLVAGVVVVSGVGYTIGKGFSGTNTKAVAPVVQAEATVSSDMLKSLRDENKLFELSYEKPDMMQAVSMLKTVSTAPCVPYYVLTVNDKVVGHFLTAEEPKAILSKLLYLPKDNYSDLGYYYNEDVKINKELVSAAGVVEYDKADDIHKYVMSGQKNSVTYTVVKGDFIEKIALKFGVSPQDILDMNPYLQTKKYLNIGDELVVMKSNPMITANVSYVSEYTQKITPEVVYEDTSTLFKGDQRIKDEGKDGEESVVAKVYTQNGIEINREVISSNVVKQPVKKLVLMGTKAIPKTAPASVSVQSRGGTRTDLRGLKIQSPVSGYLVTSPYGYRGKSFHSGIDLALSTGNPIYAAESGTVTYVGYDGAYGNTVRISHGSGVTTLYAHCSALLVNVGDKISKGGLIARVGSTGRSTGPHVHFEVIIDGVTCNPSEFYGF